MSLSATAAAEGENNTAPSQPRLSTNTATSESAADRGVFWAQKYRNYCQFVHSIAAYMPDVQPWATTLRITPLCAFQIQLELTFGGAIDAHQRGDNEGRDRQASAILRHNASDYGIELSKLKPDDYVKLVRYASLFCILAAEDGVTH